jgi:translation initiation factor 3 subunit B
MAPSFDQLSDHDLEPEEDEIDFTDLQERYDVHLEQGLDTFVVSNSICEHLTSSG